MLWKILAILMMPADLVAQQPLNTVAYANLCFQKMGPFPKFDCLKGTILQTYKLADPLDPESELVAISDDEKMDQSTRCVNPYIATSKLTESPCYPASRIQRIPGYKPSITWMMVCRAYGMQKFNDNHFDAIQVIVHDRETGETCAWESQSHYDLQMRQNGQPANGSEIPSPCDESQTNFWLTPEKTFTWGSCPSCHLTYPWINSPITFGLLGEDGERLVPKNIFDDSAKFIWLANDRLGVNPLFASRKRYEISNKDNQCLYGCHTLPVAWKTAMPNQMASRMVAEIPWKFGPSSPNRPTYETAVFTRDHQYLPENGLPFSSQIHIFSNAKMFGLYDNKAEWLESPHYKDFLETRRCTLPQFASGECETRFFE